MIFQVFHRLALVSTPNAEYNSVLAAASGGSTLLHNGLRHRDHRFEWCVSSCVLSVRSAGASEQRVAQSAPPLQGVRR